VNASRSRRTSVLASPSPVPPSDELAHQLLENSKEYVKSLLSNVDSATREDSIRALRSIKRNLPRLKNSLGNIQAANNMSPTTELENITSDFILFEDKMMNLTQNLRRGLDRLQEMRASMEEKAKAEELSKESLQKSLIAYTKELRDTIAEMTSKIDSLDTENIELQRQLKEAKEHILRLDELMLRTMKREEMTTRKFRHKIRDTIADQDRLEWRLLDLFDSNEQVTKEQFADCLNDNRDIRRRVIEYREKHNALSMDIEAIQDSTLRATTPESIFRGKRLTDLSISEREFDSTLQDARRELISTLHMDTNNRSFYSRVEHEFNEVMTLDDEYLGLLIAEEHDVAMADQIEIEATTIGNISVAHEEVISSTDLEIEDGEQTQSENSAHSSRESSATPSAPRFDSRIENLKQVYSEPHNRVRTRSNSLPSAFVSTWQKDFAEREAIEKEATTYQQKQIFKRFLKMKEEFSEIDDTVAQLYKKLGINEDEILPENEEAVQTDSCVMTGVSVQCDGSSFQVHDFSHCKQRSSLCSAAQQTDLSEENGSDRAHPQSSSRTKSVASMGSFSHRSESFSFNDFLRSSSERHLNGGASDATVHQETQTNLGLSLQSIIDAVETDKWLAYELRRHLQVHSPLRNVDADQSIRSMRSSPNKRASMLPQIRKSTLNNEEFNDGTFNDNRISPRLLEDAPSSKALRHGNASNFRKEKKNIRELSNTEKTRIMMGRINIARRAYNDDLMWNKRVKYRVREDSLTDVIKDNKSVRKKARNPALSTNAKIINMHDHKNSFVTAQELLHLRTNLPQGNISRT